MAENPVMLLIIFHWRGALQRYSTPMPSPWRSSFFLPFLPFPPFPPFPAYEGTIRRSGLRPSSSCI